MLVGEGIVLDYNESHRPRAQAELDWFGRQPTLRSAIKNAATAVMRAPIWPTWPHSLRDPLGMFTPHTGQRHLAPAIVPGGNPVVGDRRADLEVDPAGLEIRHKTQGAAPILLLAQPGRLQKGYFGATRRVRAGHGACPMWPWRTFFSCLESSDTFFRGRLP